MTRIEKVNEWLKDNCSRQIIYIGRVGAQNYHLEREGSDYDYKAIAIPSLEEIAMAHQPISTRKDIPIEICEGAVDIKDMRLMAKQWKKGSANFLEILFTDEYYINPRYVDEITKFKENNEAIAAANMSAIARAMWGACNEKRHAMTHRYPCQVDEIDKYGYAAKQLHHLVRCAAMIEQLGKLSFQTVIDPLGSDDAPKSYKNFFTFIKKIKTREVEYTVEEAEKFADKMMDRVRHIVDNIVATATINNDIMNFIDSMTVDIIKKAIGDELRNETSV